MLGSDGSNGCSQPHDAGIAVLAAEPTAMAVLPNTGPYCCIPGEGEFFHSGWFLPAGAFNAQLFFTLVAFLVVFYPFQARSLCSLLPQFPTGQSMLLLSASPVVIVLQMFPWETGFPEVTLMFLLFNIPYIIFISVFQKQYCFWVVPFLLILQLS